MKGALLPGPPAQAFGGSPFNYLVFSQARIVLDRPVMPGNISADAEIANSAHSRLGSCARERGPGAHHSSDHARLADRVLHKSHRIFGVESTGRLQKVARLNLRDRRFGHSRRDHSRDLLNPFLSTRTAKFAELSQFAFYRSGLGICWGTRRSFVSKRSSLVRRRRDAAGRLRENLCGSIWLQSIFRRAIRRTRLRMEK